MIKNLFKELKNGVTIWFFVTITLLYGFSLRMPLISYVVPYTLFLYYISTRYKALLKIKKEFLLHYSILGVFALCYLFGGLLYLDFDVRIRIGLYVFTIFIPLSVIFFNEFLKCNIKESTRKIFIVFLFLGVLAFLFYQKGIITRFRYQQVGNILAASSVLSFSIKNKYFKWITFFTLIFMVFIVGSRQSLISVLIVGLLYLFIKNFKLLIFSIISVIIVIINKNYLFEKLTDFAYEYKYKTLIRLVFALNSESVLGRRAEIYSSLIKKIKLYPNFTFSPNNIDFYPHNFFLEYFIVCGLVLGLLFMLFIFYIISRSVKQIKNQTLFYFVLVFFLPFNISSGFTAAKYFLFFLPAIIYWSSVNTEYFNKN